VGVLGIAARIIGWAVLAAALTVPADAQPSLVDPASQIRTYRLTMDNVRRVERVSQVLDSYVPIGRRLSATRYIP
jgi:hypothetical protein